MDMLHLCALVALLLSSVELRVTGQGLDNPEAPLLGAGMVQQQLATVYAKSKAWRIAFSNSQRRTSLCSASGGSLCAAGTKSPDEISQLQMATSPQSFDARSSDQMGGFTAVGQPKNQGNCNTCVAFTILAAAQSAIAVALKRDATGSISEMDFFFCKSLPRGEERQCTSSWNMRDGLRALVDMIDGKRYPTTDTCLPYDPTSPSCSDADCDYIDPSLKQGEFSYISLETPWEIMEHIREWGSAITRLEIYDDFKPFFNTNPGGVYPGHKPKASKVASHAIQLIGYDVEKGHYTAKNSWGTDFAAGGFFKIAIGVDGVGQPGDTFGIKFNLFQPLPKPVGRLAPSVAKPGCYDYRALQSDFVSRLSFVWGIPIERILLDNLQIISEPDMTLAGLTVTLCGIAPQLLKGVKGAPAPMPVPAAAAPVKGQAPTPLTKPAPLTKLAPTPVPTPVAHAPTPAPLPVAAAAPAPAKASPVPAPALLPVPGAAKPPVAAAAAPAVKMGTYQGDVYCRNAQANTLTNNGARLSSTAVLTPGGAATAGTVFVDYTGTVASLWSSCTYAFRAACTLGDPKMCGPGRMPLSCGIASISQFADTCEFSRVARPTSFKLCYDGGSSIAVVDLQPTCSSTSGSVALQ